MNQVTKATSPSDTPVGGRGATVLVVEDSPVQTELLRRALEAASYRVITAANGAEGLATAKAQRPAAVVSDVNMPVMDGYTMCEAMCREASFNSTPIILLTMLSDPEDLIRGLNAGADGYLTKPYDVSALVSRLASLLDNPPTRQSADERRSVEVKLAGKTHLVYADSTRMLNLLISTYENAVLQNQALVSAETALDNLNQHLEQKVQEKTATLALEIKKHADLQIRLESEHRASAEQLQETYLSTIHAISLALEKRDAYTSGHQRRASELATAIAREIGLTPHRIEGLRVSGLLYDLGKISVPADILNRTRPLNKSELALSRAHVQNGYEILREIKFPWPVAQIVLQHHERLDGSGYPAGLKGDAILLEAKILAVADVVEAMCSHRPQRPAPGIDAALEKISQDRGVLYDVDAVDACIRLFREKGFAFALANNGNGAKQ